MNKRNLIPVQRLHAKRTQRAIRRWILIDTIFILALLIGGALYAAATLGDSVTSRADPAGVHFESSNAELTRLREESATLQTILQSALQVSDRPDWSILLAAISSTLGDDAVLNSVDSTEDAAAAKEGAAHDDGVPLRFRISGVGRSQQSALQIVLRLEQLKFFSRVHLVQTGPQPLLGQECVGFQIICELQENRWRQD